MKFECAAVYAGEEILAQPRSQNRQGAEASRKERNQESPPVVETNFQQAAIASTKCFEGLLKTLLKPHQRIAARRISRLVFLSPQQVLGHGRNDGPRQKIRGQHGENHCFCERYKEVPSHAGEQEHRSKDNADRKCGHESRSGNLRGTVQNNCVHVLVWFPLPISVYVLDLHSGIVNQDPNRQCEST